MESIFLRRNLALSLKKGFTLIELMVVLAIVAVVTSIVLNNQSSFNKTLVLANTAYDIALTLRSAQTYGLGSRGVGAAANVGYGVHFVRGSADSFTFFADTAGGVSCAGATPDCKPGDHVYTEGDTTVQAYKLGNGMTVSDICAYSLGSWSCASEGLTSLDIVFSRPNPDPFMSKDGSYSEDPAFRVTAACLVISSPQGSSQYVSVGSSGQINANAASCS